MPRSVCLLTNAYPDFPDSNRVVFIRNLAQLLSRRGWDVSVVVPRIFCGSKSRERENEIEVRRFSSFLDDKLLIEYSHTPALRLAGYMAAGIVSAIRCIRERQCELIHAHWVVPAGLIALVAGLMCRKPVVVTAHGSDILVVADRNPLIRTLTKFVLNHADAVTSVAEHLTERILGMGIRKEAISTFPMSVPIESFCTEGPSREEWGSGNVIFSNRGLYPIYNVELLVRAAPDILKEIPGAVIVIAGEGPERERLVSLAGELGVADRIRFVGAVPHEEMPQYLRAASVYVSTALSDGASVSLLEAMACGTFPVVAEIPANREWVEDGQNGYLFAPTEKASLAEKIVTALNRPDLRAKARDENVQIVRQKARWDSNIEKLIELYATVLKDSG